MCRHSGSPAAIVRCVRRIVFGSAAIQKTFSAAIWSPHIRAAKCSRAWARISSG